MNTTQFSYTSLDTYGWTESRTLEFAPYQGLLYIPVRIYREGRGLFWGTDGEHQLLLERSGTFQNMQDLLIQPNPVVGDWCAVQRYAPGRGLIEAVLPRKQVFHKPVVQDPYGIAGEAQAVVANVDACAIVMDARNDFNLRRIERFVSLLHADEIPPLLILTKIDLLEDVESYRMQIVSRFPDLQVFLVDSLSGKGIDSLLTNLKPHETCMLLGMSGAGKSTLLNCLSNAMVAKTGEVRSQDGRGRHTTTNRQLYILPNGTIVIDTPGLRAIGMNNGSQQVCESFPDIAALAHFCRFSDCTHTAEIGCAVKKALLTGELEQDRFLNYLQLRDEAENWEAVASRRKKKDKEMGRLQYLYRREERR
ncbi:ribosome small subunit-dependent GTPase A [Sphaerochaeta pleomorpha str. Grapes]|uniref:Small ribosomal subunit biogenesis GTPase RsgA n=1 Tax=Sphaerochaeta pleomorpha (strain ATCC BAA-1885 / DSM 22778 / Grapes) TaxID=158190 RepID=G8QX65_SPHPG|nr:ribosome small subunit-dependent GTPase A [Sphaerochaeta pleomorpha]AEV30650.1 ribosome small subunit-dependent GTPase A [Sphaerochaeta pleomorpha str. Grapes]